MNWEILKTKLVCTIGPASDQPEVMLKLLQSGMNIARLNYAHNDFAYHARVIRDLRQAAQTAGTRLAILADLPGPKLRIGKLASEPIELKSGDDFILTTESIMGNQQRVSVSFAPLPALVQSGQTIFLNDGIIQLKVEKSEGREIHCQIRVGGELRSYKGVNLPGVDLGVSAFTEHDFDCLKSALEGGVDAISQSFVSGPEDVEQVRRAALELGYKPFIIAKIERANALEHIDAILQAADGIMIGRGDLGVEIAIERIAIVQKELISKANQLGKPVITATQMLESMVANPRPTRAEVTDVANAILDGTDCLMLSEESAMGHYPVEAVQMLGKIALVTEPHQPQYNRLALPENDAENDSPDVTDIISQDVQHTIEQLKPVAILAHTNTGHTARMLARFHFPVWITAVSQSEAVCQQLQFSSGVISICVEHAPTDWKSFIRQQLKADDLPDGWVLLVEGPSPDNPFASHKMELIDTSKD